MEFLFSIATQLESLGLSSKQGQNAGSCLRSSQKLYESDHKKVCPENTASVILCKYGDWTRSGPHESQSYFSFTLVFLVTGGFRPIWFWRHSNLWSQWPEKQWSTGTAVWRQIKQWHVWKSELFCIYACFFARRINSSFFEADKFCSKNNVKSSSGPSANLYCFSFTLVFWHRKKAHRGRPVWEFELFFIYTCFFDTKRRLWDTHCLSVWLQKIWIKFHLHLFFYRRTWKGAGAERRRRISSEKELGQSPHKNCKNDLDDQTWQELE